MKALSRAIGWLGIIGILGLTGATRLSAEEKPVRLHHLTLSTEPRTTVPFAINIDGVTIHELSTNFLGKLFALLDREQNGELSELELHAAPRADELQRLLRGDFANLTETGLPLNLKPGANLAAFTSEYQRQGGVGWAVEVRDGSGKLDNRLIDELFEVLAAGDPRGLSRASLEQAPERLRRWDLNDDELWTAAELSVDLHRRPRNDLPQLLIDATYDTRHRDAVAEGLLVGFNTEVHAAVTMLNRKKDDIHARWLRASDDIVLSRGQTYLHFRTLGEAVVDFPARREELQQQWEADDADLNQRLDAAEIAASPMAVTWRQLSRTADANRDHQLAAEEFAAYLDLLASGAETLVVVRVEDNGRVLFRTLDFDGDDRVTLRELTYAGKRLTELWDIDGDQYVSRDEIPRHFSVILGVGGSHSKSAACDEPKSAPAASPVWFGRMDRNGDGDISPREFLGPAGAFAKLDRNHDRLIDAEEAAAAK